MKTRFTYRELGRGKRDVEGLANWSATPGADEHDRVERRAELIRAADRDRLVEGPKVQSALAHIRQEHPASAEITLELLSLDAVADTGQRVVYVDIDARIQALDAEGRPVLAGEYDHLAAQLIMDALERGVE